MVFRIGSDNTEVFTLETNVSRSIVGFNDRTLTGSIFVIPRQLQGLRQTFQTEKMLLSSSTDSTLESFRIENVLRYVGDDPYGKDTLEQYMQLVHGSPVNQKYNSTASIYIFTPPTVYNKNAERVFATKRLLKNNPTTYGQESNWSTTNYHSLNFFTSSNTSLSSALIYPSCLSIRKATPGNTLDFPDIVFNSELDFMSGSGIDNSYGTSYQLYNAFSFDFWIKPRYNADGTPLWYESGWSLDDSYYRPGAIIHYSSSYLISIHSGSSRDKNDLVNDFRICLQLGEDARLAPDTIPYAVDNSGSILGCTFWTENTIPLTEWTHIAITYGGQYYNQGTGAIWINGVKDRDIAIGQIIPLATYSLNTNQNSWGAIYLGNFYENTPQEDSSSTSGVSSYNHQARFWSQADSGDGPGDWESRVGYALLTLQRRTYNQVLPGGEVFYYPLDAIAPSIYGTGPNQGVPPWDSPFEHKFRFPLSSEIHDIRLWAKQLTYEDIQYFQTGSTRESDIPNLRFWVPPFFIQESKAKFNEPITPFYSIGSPPQDSNNVPISSSSPFAAKLALSLNGYYPNLDNYLTDIISDTPPIAWDLRWWPEAVSPLTDITSDQWMYENLVSASQIRKRLYTVLPSDHGNYKPSWHLLDKLGYATTNFVNQFGSSTKGRINLDEIMYYSDSDENTSVVGFTPSGLLTQNAQNFLKAYNEDISSSITNDLLGSRPEDPTAPPGFGMAIWQRMQSNDSNFVTMIDISNLYYDECIKPGTFEFKVPALSGSGGGIPGMTIRDNGRGGLYRVDTTSDPAYWSTIGSISYNEGVAIIKYPQLYFISKENWSIKFRGQRNVYVYTIETFANPQTCTESTDPVYPNIVLPPAVDYDPSETDRKQVFIGSVLIHDENLNVIARSNLAQPIVKRSSDKLMFRVKIDF